MTPSSGSAETFPDFSINSVPQALVAETLQGILPAGFIQTAGNVTQANMTTLTGSSDASALHHHDGRYLNSGSAAALVANSYVNGNFGIGTSVPSTDIGFGGNTERTIGVNRTTGTDGSDLTVSAGGAVSAGTNRAGGDLIMSSGTSTGTGSSKIEFKTATAAGGSGSADNTPSTKMTILGDGNVGIGTASPFAPLDVYGNSGTTTTSSDINSKGAAGTGNITVGSTSGFPSSGIILIEGEAMSYSVVNGTTLNIIARARLGTTGATHTNGVPIAFVEQILSKGATAFPHLVAVSNGNVGVGTIPRNNKLVVGNSDADYFSDNTGISITNANMTNGDLWGVYAGQSSSSAGGFQWVYNSTPANAGLYMDTANYSNPIYIDASKLILMGLTPGNVGIGTSNPDSRMHLNGSGAGRGLCVTSDDDCAAVPTGGQISAETTLNTGADYAEYFLSEAALKSGQIVGLNPTTRLARAYQLGDQLLGVVSTKPGVIGNSRIHKELSVLVALIGQVPFNSSEVQINGNVVSTLDGKQIGFLLASGDIYVNIGSKDYDRQMANLEADNAVLKLESAAKTNEIRSIKESNEKKSAEILSLKSYLCNKDPVAPFCH